MSSIWDTINTEKQKAKVHIQKELSDEIKEMRASKRVFSSTNDTEHYIVICFSTNQDKKTFVQNVLKNKKNETYFDGYEFARIIGGHPCKPSFKLPKPLNKK